MSEHISRAGLLALVDQWLAEGHRVVGPVAPEAGPVAPPPGGPSGGPVRFAVLTDSAQLRLEGFVHAANSAKEWVLPKTEKLYDYVREGREVRLSEPDDQPVRTL